jgi:glucans biosynthesis protein
MSHCSRAPARFLLLLVLAVAMPAFGFDFDDVSARAQKLAAAPYAKPAFNLPKELLDLNYDQYRDIRFDPDKALWRNRKLPFEIQFFHPGFYFNEPVRINVITADGVHPLKFKPTQFDYGKNTLDVSKLGDIGYAGFRVHFNLNRPDYKDEAVVFQGASYFRAVGKGQRYGLSARGLAIDTGLLSGEEFPRFTDFWIAWPKGKDQHLVVYALLDSRRASGAYKFVLRPGETTEMDVKARLFMRDNVSKLGIAPMSSMFYFGENQRTGIEDYRPEVHDSDGLLMHTGGDEWIWRPLLNPRRLLITSFAMQNPRGFGLMQRDRKFSSYEDLEARYDLRPSTWVKPRGQWGNGRVEVAMLPTPDETNDNIVAYWVPDNPPAPGRPYDLNYTLSWQKDNETRPPTSRAVQSRRGHGQAGDTIRMVVDFEGPKLDALPAESKPFGAIWMGENGELLERQVFRNDVTGGWRLAFRLRRLDPEKPVEIRALLKNEQEVLSETWSYILAP